MGLWNSCPQGFVGTVSLQKFIIIAVLVFSVSLFGLLVRGRRRALPWLALGLGFLPFFEVTLNPISFERYRGDSRGLEFALVDFFACAVVIALPMPKGRSSPLRWTFVLYLMVCLASLFQAQSPVLASFAVWKVLRTFLLFVAVTRICQQGQQAGNILRGLAWGIVYAAGLALWQRYALGMHAARGPFSHQNGLGQTANLVFPIFYALVLTGQGGRLAQASCVASAICVVLSLSRGSMALFVVALALVFVGACARKVSWRILGVSALTATGGIVLLVQSYDTIVQRFLTAPEASKEARHAFNEVAAAMLNDHVLGIGMNQFSLVLNLKYADKFGIPDIDRDGLVHNVFWLTASELGYVGLMVFVVLLMTPLWIAIPQALNRRRAGQRDVMWGLVVGLGVVIVQGTLEWSLRMTQVGYVYWVVAGVAVSLAGMRSSGESQRAGESA